MLHQTITSAVCEASTVWLYDPNVVGRNWTYYWAQYSSTCSNQEPFIQQSLWAPGGTTIKTRISSKGKISSLAMAEKVWLIFSSTHNCMVLTNIKQFIKRENKQTSQWYNSCQEALLQHRNDLQKQIALLCCARFKKRLCHPRKKSTGTIASMTTRTNKKICAEMKRHASQQYAEMQQYGQLNKAL